MVQQGSCESPSRDRLSGASSWASSPPLSRARHVCDELSWTVSCSTVPYLRLLPNPSSYAPGNCAMPRDQGLLKNFRNTGLVSNGRCHVCTRGQNSQYQLEKQALLTFCGRFPCADACLTSSSPKQLICGFFLKKVSSSSVPPTGCHAACI